MKKIILLIAVIAVATLTTFAFTAQTSNTVVVNTEVTNDEFEPVEFKDLPAETQEMLLKEFDGYVIKSIFQNKENKLLKVVVVKDDEEKTFIQNEEGKFIEK